MPDARLTDTQYLLYVVLTNYLTIFSGVMFLLSFILMGLMALRVSRVFGVRTHWPLMFLGPIGTLVYSVYTIVHGAGPAGSREAYMLERMGAYGAFLACGILCWWGVRRFWKSLGTLMKEGRQMKYLRDQRAEDA